MELVTKDPLAGHNIRTRRARNESPCVVGHKSAELLLHSMTPIGIGESSAIGLRDRREWRGCVKCSRLAKTKLPSGDHLVLIHHWLDRHDTFGKGRRRSSSQAWTSCVHLGRWRHERTWGVHRCRSWGGRQSRRGRAWRGRRGRGCRAWRGGRRRRGRAWRGR